MSIFLHGAKSLNQILPQEKHANGDNFGTFSKETEGLFWKTNVDKYKQIKIVFTRKAFISSVNFSQKA